MEQRLRRDLASRHLPIGTLLLNHLQGLCPSAQNNPVTADHRLLACVRGQVHLTTLEKMGKIHFL